MTRAARQRTQRKSSAAVHYRRVNERLISVVDNRLKMKRPVDFTVLTLTKGGAHPKEMTISSVYERTPKREAHTTWGKKRPKVIGGMLPQKSRTSERLVDEWRRMGLKSDKEIYAHLSVLLAREKPQTLARLIGEISNPQHTFPDGFKRIIKDFFNAKTGRHK